MARKSSKRRKEGRAEPVRGSGPIQSTPEDARQEKAAFLWMGGITLVLVVLLYFLFLN